jgi:Tfp pilus assembly protein PilF
MSQALERGQLLLAQGRANEALNDLMIHLAGDPESIEGHMLVAICLSHLDRDDDALSHAQKCVALAPDYPPCHVILGKVHLGRDKYELARESAQNAIVLDPDEVEAWTVVAASHVGKLEWTHALAAAEKGLAIEPDHNLCRNYCVIALTKLGRKEEAKFAAYGALSQDPENPITHASTGWAHLHGGKAKDALPHFKESLRLDPGNEWARAGFVEAMKSRNIIYAFFLRFALWMSGFKPNVRIGLIVGAVILVNVVGRMGESYPVLKRPAQVIQATYFLFVVGVWISSSFFDALLLFSSEGRNALTPRQRITSVVLLFTIAFSTLFAGLLASESGFDFWLLVIPYFILFPMMMTCNSRVGWPLAFSLIYTLVVLGLFIATFAHTAGMINYYIYGCVIATWIGGLIPNK